MSDDSDHSPWAEQYHPVEHKILSDYLKVKPLVPVSGIDIRKAPQNTDHIYVEKDMEGEYSGISLDNAVARICLEHVQDQLPQWAEMYPDGRIILGRTLRPVINRPVVLIARPLFTINWAESGPGIAWPEAYNVTYIPGYHHYVVTASQDSPDVYGYTDEAIGYFSGDTEEVDRTCGEVIRDWWAGISSQQPWKSLDRRGNDTVDQPTAAGIPD
jgi:hypothetical protein